MAEFWNKLVPEMTVFDYQASRRFYVDILGFKPRHERSDPNFGYFDLNDAQIMLEEFHETGWNTGELEPPLGRGINFQIEVDDIQPIYDSVKQNSIPFFRDLKESWYEVNGKKEGQKEFLIQDPDGYLLRFTEVLEG